MPTQAYLKSLFYLEVSLIIEFLKVKIQMTSNATRDFNEKRRYKRILAPKEATALFKNKKGTLDRVPIRNLSLCGILICDSIQGGKHATGSVINNIYLTITVSDPGNGRKFFIHVNKGKIVRSFVGETPHIICYGLEFFYSSSYVEEQFESLINKLTPDTNHQWR